MKIAFPTNDKETIAQRTGRAKEFVIYEIDNSVIVNTSYKKNTHSHDHSHNHNHGHSHDNEHGHSHKEIIDILKGIDLLVVRAIGKHFKQEVTEASINYELTKTENIKDLLSKYL